MKKGSVLFLSITLICIAAIVLLIRWLIETYYIYIVLIIAFSIMIIKYSTEKEENKEETRKMYIPKDINTKKNKKNIDNYDLEDWQKELVDDGSYEPYNFEEEELEDDDYYSEDDD